MADEPALNLSGKNAVNGEDFPYSDPISQVTIPSITSEPLTSDQWLTQLEVVTTGPAAQISAASADALSLSTRAAGADLAVQNLTAKGTQPFSYLNYTDFELQIVNIGTGTIPNVYVELYVDGDFFSDGLMESLAPGYMVTWTWPIKGLSGAHTLEFQVGNDGGITETDYSNNSISGTYTWESVIDLSPYSINSDQGDIFESCRNGDVEMALIGEPETLYRTFTVQIANFGNTIAHNVQIQLYDDKGPIGPASLGTITGETLHSYTISVSITKKNPAFKLGVYVVPVNEANTSNQLLYSSPYPVTYDTETFASRFEPTLANQLKVNIASRIYDMFETVGITEAETNATLLQWNPLSPRVNLSITNQNYNVAVKSSPDLGDTVLGLTNLNTANGPVDNVLTETAPYTSATILINQWLYTLNDPEVCKTTLAHEMGHVLGQKHAYCDDDSIMTPGSNFTAPQPHDADNLNKLY